MTIDEQITEVKNKAIMAFSKNHPNEARQFIKELQRLDKIKFEQYYDCSDNDSD